MTDEAPPVQIALHAGNFDAFYQTATGKDGVEFGTVPWDIGKEQPAVVELEAAGRFSGEVLDIGCGLGDNSIFLASRGYKVAGVDFAPTAIERAKGRAKEHGVDVEFAVADATELPGYEGRFGTVLDSSLYHCLSDDQKKQYAATLHRVTTPGAMLNMFCFSDLHTETEGIPPMWRVTEENIRTTFTDAGWEITDLHRSTIPISLRGDAANQMGVTGATDEEGHLRAPVWALQGQRA